MSIRFYFKLAVQFVQSLAHSSETDSRFLTYSTEQTQALGWYASTEILYLQDHNLGLVLKTDAGLRSFGVAMYIGQALL